MKKRTRWRHHRKVSFSSDSLALLRQRPIHGRYTCLWQKFQCDVASRKVRLAAKIIWISQNIFWTSWPFIHHDWTQLRFSRTCTIAPVLYLKRGRFILRKDYFVSRCILNFANASSSLFSGHYASPNTYLTSFFAWKWNMKQLMHSCPFKRMA